MTRRAPRFRLRWALAAAAVGLVLLPAAEVGCVRFVNPPATPEMLRFRLGPKSRAAAARGLRYEWIDFDKVPVPFLHYLWASEDQRFFEHDGIDLAEIDQALDEARRSGKPPRGASTITQQCARSLFLWQGRSWLRKGLEAYYVFWMERLLSKRRIFELYVNVIEFGEGIYGAQAASKTFYGAPPARLTRSQLAMLAAVIAAPRQWSPAAPSPRLLRRQQRVLRLARNAAFPAAALGE